MATMPPNDLRFLLVGTQLWRRIASLPVSQKRVSFLLTSATFSVKAFPEISLIAFYGDQNRKDDKILIAFVRLSTWSGQVADWQSISLIQYPRVTSERLGRILTSTS